MATNQPRHKCYSCGRKLVESKMYSEDLRGHNGRYYTHWFCGPNKFKKSCKSVLMFQGHKDSKIVEKSTQNSNLKESQNPD